jgi:sigma-B regulation protein RsbU (phosphoserine phosphatase)
MAGLEVDRRSHTILIVDDDEMVRRAIATMLTAQGYAVRNAADGSAALEELAREQPSLVLCDLRMPRLDGLQLLAEVRATHPALPVIVMSGAGLLDDAIRALQLGAWDYVEKPIPAAAALGHTVARALERAALLETTARQQVRLEEINRELAASLQLLADEEAAGRELQLRMLPADHLRFGAFEITRELAPSAFLSGDFIDAFRIDAHHFGFYLADVAGHGVSSALVAVSLRTVVERLVTEATRSGDDVIRHPARLLARLNAEMSLARLEKHLTMFYGVIDERDATLTYANAGQFPWPIVFDGEAVTVLATPSTPIGLTASAHYTEQQLALAPGATLAAFSDGLFEILPHEDLARKERFLTALFGRRDITLAQIRRELHLDGGQRLPDDIAMLLVRRGGKDA